MNAVCRLVSVLAVFGATLTPTVGGSNLVHKAGNSYGHETTMQPAGPFGKRGSSDAYCFPSGHIVATRMIPPACRTRSPLSS